MQASEEPRDKSLAALRAEARQRGLPGASRLSKEALIARLAQDDAWRATKLTELRNMARQRGLSGVQSLTKAELIERLHRHDLAAAETPPEQAVEASDWLIPPRPWMGRGLRMAALLGMALSAAGLVGLLVVARRTVPRLGAQLEGAAVNVAAVSRTLEAAARSLRSSSDALTETASGLAAAEATLADTGPLLESVSHLVGHQTPETIRSTRQALLDAQEGARAMDRVLRGLALLGLDYNPDTPLDESLALTADSLEPLPAALARVDGDLQVAQQDLGVMRDEFGAMGEGLQELAGELAPLANQVDRQADQMDETAEALHAASDLWPRWAWMGISLASLLIVLAGLGLYPLYVLGKMMDVGLPRIVEG